MASSTYTITAVDVKKQWPTLRSTLVEFHDWMADHVPELYDPDEELTDDFRMLTQEPESWAWMAYGGDTVAGCVLLHGASDKLAEFRRLWVRESHRGEGIGRALTETVIEKAGSEGYERLALTTPPWGKAAQALYESLGFERTPPYPETRLPEEHHEKAIFMQLDLTTLERLQNNS